MTRSETSALRLPRNASKVPAGSCLFAQPFLAAVDRRLESGQLFRVTPKTLAQIAAAALASSVSIEAVHPCVLRKNTSSLKGILNCRGFKLFKDPTPENCCSTPEVEQPQPIARLRASSILAGGGHALFCVGFPLLLEQHISMRTHFRHFISNLYCARGCRSLYSTINCSLIQVQNLAQFLQFCFDF